MAVAAENQVSLSDRFNEFLFSVLVLFYFVFS